MNIPEMVASLKRCIKGIEDSPAVSDTIWASGDIPPHPTVVDEINSVIEQLRNSQESGSGQNSAELRKFLLLADKFCDEGNCTLCKSSINSALNSLPCGKNNKQIDAISLLRYLFYMRLPLGNKIEEYVPEEYAKKIYTLLSEKQH